MSIKKSWARDCNLAIGSAIANALGIRASDIEVSMILNGMEILLDEDEEPQ